MALQRMDIGPQQVVIHSTGTLCTTNEELAASHAFAQVVQAYVDDLRRQGSALLEAIPLQLDGQHGVSRLVALLNALAVSPIDEIAATSADFSDCVQYRSALHRFVEELYDYWRRHLRYMVVHSLPGPESFERRPYRAFNQTVEKLTHIVRGLYRDVCENITGDHPSVYRQVPAGCNVGMIAVQKEATLPAPYARTLRDISCIRQLWIDPPLIFDPPINKRMGVFSRVEKNPLERVALDASQFLCYPAQVGPLLVLIYFHQEFMGLGTALANLFELASEESLARAPDAVFVFGVPSEAMVEFGELPAVFYDDQVNHLLVGAIPLEHRFGYFGYVKKMVLTLHNAAMLKKGRMPFHGAFTHIVLRNGTAANVLLIGDTATGKSESLEAFRVLGRDTIRDLRIVADDMGSLELDQEGKVIGYGTETGAFIRLDDLQQGYAFGQIDRAIIMSPQKVNARVVLPVTTLGEILRGYRVDYLLYANNYEEVSEDHLIVERFTSYETALQVFREGAAMSKGTTVATGLVHSYFANIFGAPQYKELHEVAATKVFQAAFASGVFVAQLRTRLGIPGYETRGPEQAAQALLGIIAGAQ
jgi:hypothetical protein